MTYRKIVDYPFRAGGYLFNKKGTPVSDDISKKNKEEIARAVMLGQIEVIGGDITSTTGNAELEEVKTQLAEAQAELENCGNVDSIINDINTMSLKDLKIKYPKVEE